MVQAGIVCVVGGTGKDKTGVSAIYAINRNLFYCCSVLILSSDLSIDCSNSRSIP